MTQPGGKDACILVVTSISPFSLAYKDNDESLPIIDDSEQRLDAMDEFNHPRIRKAHILTAFRSKYGELCTFECPTNNNDKEVNTLLKRYESIHSTGLITFLLTAWTLWSNLGERRDPMTSLKIEGAVADYVEQNGSVVAVPPLVPGNVPLHRDPHQKPSGNPMGQIGWYCTDSCTPVYAHLLTELSQDAVIMDNALQRLLSSFSSQQSPTVVYALPTHPGHHSARDSFGGYCYLNHAAYAASVLLQHVSKVAVLDVDYHCGNGTASIFYDNPSVIVVSLHCSPEFEYPFHSGFEDENNDSLYHLPMLPGANWDTYKISLEKGLKRITEFGAQALVVSLGLDTLEGDPCALRRAGFCLRGNDYVEMGRMIGSMVPLQTIFVQEGGYKMGEIGLAAADVVAGCASQQRT